MLRIRAYPHKVAKYKPYPGTRYRGNPLVECLGLEKHTKDRIFNGLAMKPPPRGDDVANWTDFVRQQELGVIKEIIYPRPAYRHAASQIVSTVLSAYAGEDPRSNTDVAMQHYLATLEADDVFANRNLDYSPSFTPGWRGDAGGYGLFGCTGSGKTTLFRAIEQLLGRVIRHERYDGIDLNYTQLPVVRVSIPHDATLRTFTKLFGAVIDHHLGVQLYEKQLGHLRTIGDAALQIVRICATLRIGAVLVDDLQNLRAARGKGIEIALNLLALLIDFGTSVIVSATPAAGELIEFNVRGIRKLISEGSVELKMMPPGSTESQMFQQLYWRYQYTLACTPHSPEIQKAWEEASAGNPAFAALAFKLVQARAIGNRDARGVPQEAITPELFKHVLYVDMALLKPAIDALNSNDPAKREMFDDLVFKKKLRELLDQVRTPTDDPKDNSPFADEDDAAFEPHGKAGILVPVARKLRLPAEDAVRLMWP